jgi:hypothetical protein
MTPVSRPLKRYRVKHWSSGGEVIQVMSWAVIDIRTHRGSLPIMARCYSRYRAEKICQALNAQGKG